jgi:hypothetical protein
MPTKRKIGCSIMLSVLSLFASAALSVAQAYKVTVCGLSTALSANESVPFKLPVSPGVNVTLSVQLAPDARVELQVFV